jgi:hypothetical protein
LVEMRLRLPRGILYANSLDQNCLENLKPNENRCSSILFEACSDDISLATKLTAL